MDLLLFLKETQRFLGDYSLQQKLMEFDSELSLYQYRQCLLYIISPFSCFRYSMHNEEEAQKQKRNIKLQKET